MSKDLVFLSGGKLHLGSDNHYPEERPRQLVMVAPFGISKFTVSNSEFSKFVANTGYKTTAEIPIDPASAPGMPAEFFEAGSLVFRETVGPVDLSDFTQWWTFVPGANWAEPDGPGSTIIDRHDHPVVHVSLIDALAYADWAGLSLPSEKQWEFAAKDGVETEFPWGRELTTDGDLQANTWHGRFPYQNDRGSVRPLTNSVDAFYASRYGLFNMIGNVWEWTVSEYSNNHESSPKSCCTPSRVQDGRNYVVKGGSFLCAPSYCRRYRAAARSPQEARSSTNHLGFRCAKPVV